MKKIILLLLILSLACSCNKKSPETKAVEKSVKIEYILRLSNLKNITKYERAEITNKYNLLIQKEKDPKIIQSLGELKESELNSIKNNYFMNHGNLVLWLKDELKKIN